MKDTVNCGLDAASVAKDAVYKEVVVVGNGPSGIALSYMLSGNLPYWDASSIHRHPDELLRARLNYAGAEGQSLVQQDLEGLADGLEGRSTNPVSLLLDSLQNPGADIGMTLPSMLHYKPHPEQRIDHVVLGKGPPGGSWHRMDPNLRTLSLSTWMSLPGYDYHTWEEAHPVIRVNGIAGNLHQRQCRQCAAASAATVAAAAAAAQSKVRVHKQHNSATCNNCAQEAQLSAGGGKQSASGASPLVNFNNNNINISNNNSSSSSSSTAEATAIRAAGQNHVTLPVPRRFLGLQRQVSKEVQTRALVSRVAEYYEGYVQHMQLAANFVNDTVVTSVQPFVGGGGGGSGLNGPSSRNAARWLVQGKKLSGKPFAYLCRNVVLAVGASDLPNRLGLHGENLGLPWIKHELPQLELALETHTQRERSKLKPVLIIGAGLSAADAVTICRAARVPVIHVYRNSSVGLDKMLPEAVYPEYHAVHKMMKESAIPYDLYTPLAEHTLVSVQPDAAGASATAHHVTLLNQKTGETRRFEVSYCAILIGSRPDLRLLQNIHQRVQLTPSSPSAVATTPPPANNQLHSLYEHISAALQRLSPGHTAAAAAADNWLLLRKLSWLKNLCAKCRHLPVRSSSSPLCEWSAGGPQRQHGTHASGRFARDDYRKLCGHFAGKQCECPKLLTASLKSTGGGQVAAIESRVVAEETAAPVATIQRAAELRADDAGAQLQLVALQLGEDPLRPIDCKSNPIAVNKYSNEVQRAGRRGLYAMGPLVGDNFVRFIAGGALAITAALHRPNE